MDSRQKRQTTTSQHHLGDRISRAGWITALAAGVCLWAVILAFVL
jgi:hypothetical protein